MKFKLGTLDVQDIADAVRGLDLHGCCPALATAEAAEADAARQLEAAQRALADDMRAADDVAERLRAGRASTGDLTRALERRQATALLLPRCEAHLAQTRRETQRVTAIARAKLKEEGILRTETLRSVVAALAAACEHVHDVEVAIERASPGCPDLHWPFNWY